MNHITRISSLLLLVTAAIFYTSCGGGDDPEKSEEEVQLEKLKVAQWTLQSADDGGDIRTDEYPEMTLTISGDFSTGGIYQYTSNAASWPPASPWEKTGTWKFKTGSVGNKIVRLSDDQEMTYTLSNSDKQLTIAFIYGGTDGFINGRVSSVAGDWTFVFTRP